MTLLARYRVRRPTIVSDIIDDEVVIINMDTGAYYSLDSCGVTVWQALDAGLDRQQVFATVQQRYDGPPAEMAQAVETFVAELAVEGLIAPLADDAPATPAPLPGRPAGARLPFEAPVVHKYEDMQDLILLDPIHEVDDSGWPMRLPDAEV